MSGCWVQCLGDLSGERLFWVFWEFWLFHACRYHRPFDDPATDRFFRVETGVLIPPDETPITHNFTEKVYVIGGRATDLRRNVELRPGMYAYHLPDHEHGPLDCHGGLLTVEARSYK